MTMMRRAESDKKDGPVEAYGVKGMKNTPWRKVFKSQAEFEKWLEKNEGDVEVRGTRKASIVAEDMTALVRERVVPYEPILKRFGFTEGTQNPALMRAGVMSWLMELDTNKYDANRMVVVFEKDGSVTIAAGDAKSAGPSDYSWNWRNAPPTRLAALIRDSLWEIEKRQMAAREARELLKIAREFVAEESSLDGMTNREARREINNLLHKYTGGVHHDDSWIPINNIFKVFQSAMINYTIVSAKYEEDSRGMPFRKTWKVEIEFVNERGRPTTLYGTIIASGMGPVGSPLDSYDIIAYVS